ncbi:nuclear transport factor 2 family protein [Variovorax sp. dw_954]|uniref:nuclear transport factor 2 family protein n=1 Tax=Variovorax sp. dw_954 TaxID=2720078 RepID=UPI001BD626FF|nr:nuclear transport factor 2 family protein [Variovorax sp. dw_954]
MDTTTATLDAVDAVGIAHRYIALWNEPDAARRQQMLEAGWAEDARYVDPMGRASGHEEISSMIGVVQAHYPGFRFALAGKADSHGDNLRFSWTLGPSGAADLIQGTDFAQLDDGKLQSVTGFLDKVPAGA